MKRWTTLEAGDETSISNIILAESLNIINVSAVFFDAGTLLQTFAQRLKRAKVVKPDMKIVKRVFWRYWQLELRVKQQVFRINLCIQQEVIHLCWSQVFLLFLPAREMIQFDFYIFLEWVATRNMLPFESWSTSL